MFRKEVAGKNKKNVLYPTLFSVRVKQTEDSQRARVVTQRKPILLGSISESDRRSRRFFSRTND